MLRKMQLYKEKHVNIICDRLIREGKGKLKDTTVVKKRREREVDCNKKISGNTGEMKVEKCSMDITTWTSSVTFHQNILIVMGAKAIL